jgi:NAD(P)-dependent dehydrogenase (short-subunit alcohol dehydrogenase family)
VNAAPLAIRNCVALVTGASRGLGRVFTRELLDRGAATVYAGVRDLSAPLEPGVRPIRLDVTDPDQVSAAAQECGDVTLLINNAGISNSTRLVKSPSTDPGRAEMEVNYFGMLNMCRAFAPVLANNGGGAIANMLSALSFTTFVGTGTYCTSKSAAWSLTNGIRLELRKQGTLVVGIHAAYIDTDMTATLDVPKISPAEVARLALDGIEKGAVEVLADDISRELKAALSTHPQAG